MLIYVVCLYVLTLFLVEHTSALDRAVVRNPLVEVPSTSRSNCQGGRSNHLGQKCRRKTLIHCSGRDPIGNSVPRVVLRSAG
jgi:hypothetical protein